MQLLGPLVAQFWNTKHNLPISPPEVDWIPQEMWCSLRKVTVISLK